VLSVFRFLDIIVAVRILKSRQTRNAFFAFVLCCLIVMFDYPNLNVTEGSTSNTRRVREAGHASHRREHSRLLQEEGGVPPRRRGGTGCRADVEQQPEQQEDMEQELADVELQRMEEQELEEEL
jgi:hypothetical protein